MKASLRLVIHDNFTNSVSKNTGTRAGFGGKEALRSFLEVFVEGTWSLVALGKCLRLGLNRGCIVVFNGESRNSEMRICSFEHHLSDIYAGRAETENAGFCGRDAGFCGRESRR